MVLALCGQVRNPRTAKKGKSAVELGNNGSTVSAILQWSVHLRSQALGGPDRVEANRNPRNDEPSSGKRSGVAALLLGFLKDREADLWLVCLCGIYLKGLRLGPCPLLRPSHKKFQTQQITSKCRATCAPSREIRETGRCSHEAKCRGLRL
jgi:hypothetical protein